MDKSRETLPSSPNQKAVTELTVATFMVVVESGPDAGKSCELTGASVRIGTSEACDLVLTDRQVSRVHLVLTLSPHGVLAEDLDSRNGTFMAGARIRSVYVPDGGCLTVGQTVLRVRTALERFSLAPAADERFDALIGRSRAMRELFALIRQLARTDLPVAITGETGSGKELVGRALHRTGPRRDRPFKVLDCGSILKDLLRAELFGHDKGAFTGADTERPGILEAARGGTVFLDEVGELDLAIQPQLLRALETRELQRIGSQATWPVDVRIVSATHRDLRKMAVEGAFREDLYFRLACVKVEIPPLRDRPEDIGLLAESFIEACAARHGLSRPGISAAGRAVLESHAWPGNARELKNVTETLCVLANGHPIEPALVRQVLDSHALDKPTASRAAPVAPGQGAPSAPPQASQPHRTLLEIEREAIAAALDRTSWNRTHAAELLGISRSTLVDRIRRHGLKPPGEPGD